MTRWQRYCAGLAAVIGLTPEAFAQQFPGIPSPTPAPAVPAAAAGEAAAAPPAAPQANLFSFLCPTQAQKQACKECLCQSQLGLLFNNGLAPVTALSGGLIAPLCPGTPTAAELADQGAVGAAAKIKKEEAEAKARRAAVRYLGTVSCHYFPGAEKALIGSLRGDTNECVRWEAAMALGSGCCCTKKTIQALVNCISGTDTDGSPSEVSPRVKAAAEIALVHCLECYKEIVPAKEKAEEKVPEGIKPKAPGTAPAPRPTARLAPDVQRTAYYDQIDSKPMTDIVLNARELLAQVKDQQPAKIQAGAKARPAILPSGERSMYNILANAIKQPPRPTPAPGAEGNRLVPQTTQVASLAPKPPLIELEPPTDLYHVLMARRQERMKEAQARMPSEPIATKNPSYAQPPPIAVPVPVAAMVPGADETQAKFEAATVVAPGPTGYSAVGPAPPGAIPYASPTGYEGDAYGPAPVEVQRVSEPNPLGLNHIIGEGPGSVAPVGAEPPAALAKPTSMPYWSSGTPLAPAWKNDSAAGRTDGWSPHHTIDTEPTPPLPRSQNQSSEQPYPQFPVPGNAASQAEPPRAQGPAPLQPVIQAQAQEPDPVHVQAPPSMRPTLAGLLILLQDSPEAAQRQWAATRLAAEDWNGHEQVLGALLGAAAKDPETGVRLLCIRCLVQKKMNTVATIRVLQNLKADADLQVRQEASQALAAMMSQ
jgi:hypothetical protein